MAFSLGFLIGLLDVSSPGSTATRLITLKSLWMFPIYRQSLTFKQDPACKYQEPGPVSLPTLHGKADRSSGHGKGNGPTTPCRCEETHLEGAPFGQEGSEGGLQRLQGVWLLH